MKNTVKIQNNKTVFVGLSGGVDSSVTAALLLEKGFKVVGVFIKVWQPDFYKCTWREDRLDAMRVCAKLKIPFKTLNLENEYKKEVVDYMISEYQKGRTPNPDVMCNRYVKFGGFYDWAIKNGADFVATGHYAICKTDKNRKSHLIAAKDDNKDQTYFLWTLPQYKLQKCMFPIGEIKKSFVRKIAKKYSLATAEKKDSQGLCFIGKIDIKDFLKNFINNENGNVLNVNGEIIGTHQGAMFYTIGQRHGFEIFKKDPISNRLFIISKDINSNTITVSDKIPGEENQADAKTVTLIDINQIQPWVSGGEYLARIRYRQTLQKCKLININNMWQIIFTENQPAVAIGQSAVIYDNNDCVGGGVIDKKTN